MITGNVKCDSYEEAKFFDSIIEVGLLNMDNKTKEKFKDSKIKIKCEYSNAENTDIQKETN